LALDFPEFISGFFFAQNSSITKEKQNQIEELEADKKLSLIKNKISYPQTHTEV